MHFKKQCGVNSNNQVKEDWKFKDHKPIMCSFNLSHASPWMNEVETL
jgi:hypothetical protein